MMGFEYDRVTGPVRVEYMALSALLRAPRNPKNHDIGLMHESSKRFGAVEPPTINEKTGRTVAGHGRLDTLQQSKARGEKPPERMSSATASGTSRSFAAWSSNPTGTRKPI
jgi:hypothetical protein